MGLRKGAGVIVVVAAMMATGICGGTATAGVGGTLSRVSGPSPFASCSTPPADDFLYPNAEVEPDAAANPARPANLIAVWQQDRWSGGGANGLMAGYSFDGGRSWGRTPLPFSVCAPNGFPYDRASDPAVSIGPDGTAYAIGLSFNFTDPPLSAVDSAVSTNGGRTWFRKRLIATDDQGGLDKEWITADPTHAGVAYAVWDNLHVAPTGHFTGPAFFAKTTDYGRTWSTPKAIAAKGPDQQTLGNQILVDPRSGRLYDTYAFYFCVCFSIPKVAYVTSDDGGRTWSRQHVISDLTPVGVTQPGTVLPVRSGGFPLAAISKTGQVYVVWEDSFFSGYDEIAVSTTRDRGAHWTAPHRANRPTGRPAFTPSVAVTAAGRVGITYYDVRRDNIHDAPFSTDYWATTTSDGVHFAGDRHLAGSFDLSTAPFARGLFVGDYEGLAASGSTFVAVFSMSNCRLSGCESNPTDIYSKRFSALAGDASSRRAPARTGSPSARSMPRDSPAFSGPRFAR